MEHTNRSQMDRISRYADLIYKQSGKAVRPYRADGYVNMMTKYGTQRDSSEQYKFIPEDAVPDELLTMNYESNGLFAKIIDTPAEEAVKYGFELEDVTDQKVQDFFEDALDELDWEETAMTCIKWARLFGGSIAVMLINDGRGLDEPVYIEREYTGIEGSSMYLEPGQTRTVRDLLYGLMLRSGNDCAVALALHHSKNLQKFCVCMNEKAKSLGCAHTHFCNPHGLPAEGHATTAHDLAVIAAYALKNEQFSEIVSTRSHVIQDGGCGYARSLQNKNKMLCTYEGADGVKTGYTKEAGRCLVSSATREGMRLVSVVLNSPDMYLRSAEILDSCLKTA